MPTDAVAQCVLGRRPDIGNLVARNFPLTFAQGPSATLGAWFQTVLSAGPGFVATLQGGKLDASANASQQHLLDDYTLATKAGSDLDRWVQLAYPDCLAATSSPALGTATGAPQPPAAGVTVNVAGSGSAPAGGTGTATGTAPGAALTLDDLSAWIAKNKVLLLVVAGVVLAPTVIRRF